MKFFPLISITCETIILYMLMVQRTIRLIPDTLIEGTKMAYGLLVKMAAAYVGAIAILTALVTVLA